MWDGSLWLQALFEPYPSRQAGPAWPCLCAMKPRFSLPVHPCNAAAVLQELVLPRGGGVRDYRTAVTGLSSASLHGVTTQRRQVAARLRDLLTSNTILVGAGRAHTLGSQQPPRAILGCGCAGEPPPGGCGNTAIMSFHQRALLCSCSCRRCTQAENEIS
jgi:hypothetical protein